MVLDDTPMWSLSPGRRATDLSPSERRMTKSLYDLVWQRRARLLGVTRQEVLSSIRDESQFVRIRDPYGASQMLNWMPAIMKRRREQLTNVAVAESRFRRSIC